MATIVANIILTNIFAAKLIPLFGIVASASTVFYASIFIATDILTEHHGKKDGYRSIRMGFLAVILFTAMGWLVIQFTSIDDSATISAAMKTLFSAIPRIVAAGLTAYAIAQSFDIWFFHFLREKTGRQKLWLRNNVSTFTSQFLDSVIFFTLAFVGKVPLNILLQLVFIGWLLKALIGLLDTPFIYLSYIIKGQSPPDFGRKTPTPSEATGTGL